MAGGSDPVLAKPANALSTEQAGMMPATTQLYFEDTYMFDGSAKLVSAELVDTEEQKDESTVKLRLCFDQTIYHPQGGGQPSDVGTISDKQNLLPMLNVSFSSLNKEDGRVFHDCNVTEDIAKPWLSSDINREVTMKIDDTVRRDSARLHSGGHLIDACLKEINGMNAMKGMHFPDCAYVEFKMSKEEKANLNKEEIEQQLNLKLKEKTESGEDVIVSRDENNVRHITLAGIKCPCGGTHVQNLKEMSGIKVKALKVKKDILRVSYEFE